MSRMTKSKTAWKTKAIDRGAALRYQKAELKRIKKERNQAQSELKEVKKKEKDWKNNALPLNKNLLIFISLRLFIDGHIGFRATSRVLGILQTCFGIFKAPSPQTIINWVIRYSLAKIWNYDALPALSLARNKFVSGSIWIIDTSIALGAGKILAVLELKIDHYNSDDGAPTLENINCVAISVANSWTGEAIANFLKKVIEITGKPAAYLKDGGLDLKKAVRLLNEWGFSSSSIDDVSHVVANLLKNEYSKHPLYNVFMSACGQASKKLKQTMLAFFAPPKVSTKARFMNIHKLVKWAEMVLKHSPVGRTSEGSIISKFRTALGKLPECKSFIKRFLRDVAPLLKSEKILKTKGLNLETYQECKDLVNTIPERSPVRIGFVVWMEKQLMVNESLGIGKTGLPVSSDNIESLFGLGKTHGVGAIKDANRIALHLPALCGKVTRQSAQMVMNITVNQQQEFEKKLLSLTKQRREILPNPGSLTDNLATDYCNFSLLPVPKSEEKVNNITDITVSCDQSNSPAKKMSKRIEILNETIHEWCAEAA